MSFFDGPLKIEVASASGIEAVTKRELIKLGYEPSGAFYGRMTFDGTYKDVLRANMFLRTANRVRIVLATFKATSFDELFENIKSIPWQDILTRDANIIVNAKSIKSTIYALSATQSVAKKAIIAKLQDVWHVGSLKENGSVYDIEVSIIEDIVSITLDTSGDGLHKRGYRTYLGDAPIRETLAAAMIELSVWNPSRPLIDPFCGSGTIPLEAALIGLNIAPGKMRSFACENFSNAPDERDLVQDEALSLETPDKELHISGFDINPEAIKLSIKHLNKSGLQNKVHFQVQDMRNLSSRFDYGVIVTNPPYGERLMSESELRILYKDFGEVFSKMKTWSLYTITSYKAFEKYFGKRADKIRKLYNSELECNLYQYLGEKPPKEK